MDGLFQILVIAFFIIISMMDAAARRKRKQAEQRAEAGESGTITGAREPRSLGHETTSAEMVPDQLWEEIATLARGRAPPTTPRLPPARAPGTERRSTRVGRSTSEYAGPAAPSKAPEPEETTLRPEHQHVEGHDHVEWDLEESAAAPVAPSKAPEPEETTLRPEHQHVEGHDHVEWDLEESAAAPVAPAREKPPPEGPTPGKEPPTTPRRETRSVVRTLKGSGSGSIRRAVILAEILAPPVTLRDSEHEPPG